MQDKFIIFPTPVIKVQLNENLNILKKFSHTLIPKNKYSNEGGLNSGSVNFNKEPLINLKDKITKIVNDNFVKDLDLKKSLMMQNMWYTINSHKDYNHPHLHPNYIVSGVFYVNAPENSGDLILHRDNHAHFFTIHAHTTCNNLFTSSTQSITPKNNMLILFPSWLIHSVNPNLSHEKRISIAFDFL